MNKLTTFYLIRHGTTVNNEKKILQGRGNSPLTENGIQIAKQLNKNLRKISFDLAFASNLQRAKKTAEIIIKGRNLILKTTNLLTEKSFGDFDGLPAQSYNNQVYKIFEKLSEKQKFSYKFRPNMESNAEVFARFEKFIRKIHNLNPGKTILAVTHGALIRATLVKLGFASHKQLPPGFIENGALIKLETDGKEFKIKEVKGITIKNDK